MKIRKGRLKQIVKEELQNFVSKLKTKKLNESTSVNDRVAIVLEELEKDGDKN